MGGTSVSTSPDPYVWNYNYDSSGSSTVTYQLASGSISNANGLYNSGGGNQCYIADSVNYGVNVLSGFNSTELSSMSSNYNPAIIDVQTGSVTSRLYAWSEMGYTLSAYLADTANEGSDTRYDDPYTTAINLEQFSAGIPYYIASLIADTTNGFDKKTAAYVSAITETSGTLCFTCVDPGTLGNVESDVFAEVGNFDFIVGDESETFTLEDLMDEGVDVIILGESGYSYTNDAGEVDTGDYSKADVLADLEELGYTASQVPLVMDSNIFGIKIGNNGFNYSPITPMFLPYIQAYAYMDELEALAIDGDEVAEAVNPTAMFQYMVETFFHVQADYADDVALYYIGTAWDSVGDYDQVPDIEDYTYDTESIEKAIKIGIQFALYGDSDANTLLPAVRNTDTANTILSSYLVDTKNDTDSFITIATTSGDKYINLTTLSDVSSTYAAIVTYYTSSKSNPIPSDTTGYGAYNYGYDLETLLQNYYDHMTEHVWAPLTNVVGTYGYGITASTVIA